MHKLDLEEVARIKEFIDMLNYASSNGSVVIVEGRRDALALKSLGFYGKMVILNNHKRGLTNLVEYIYHVREAILLLDMDSKGRYLTQRLVSMVTDRRRVNLFYRKRLAEITKGRIRSMEELLMYNEYINNTLQYHSMHIS